MSWLGERTLEHEYARPDGEIIVLQLKAEEDRPESITCDDGAEARFKQTRKFELNQTNIVEYDKNGRKAFRIKDGKGNIRYVSKTKMHYMKTGRIENQYTKEFKEHLEKQNEEVMLHTETNKKRAKVMPLQVKAAISDLPDGTYLSDGTKHQKLE